MRIDLSITGIDGGEHDVAVRAPDSVPAAAVAAALGCSSRPLQGAILGRPGDRSPAAGTRLDIVGGIDAGRSVRIPRGEGILGRDPNCLLVLRDPGVSRHHVALAVTESGVSLRDLGSTNGTSLDGVDVGAGRAHLRSGQVVRIADTFLALARPAGPPAAVRDGPPGRVLVNRRPRPEPASPDPAIALPTRPGDGTRQPAQWLAALLTAAAGVGLAVALGSAQLFAFALLSPVAVLASTGGDRLHWRRSRRRSMRAYAHELARTRAAIEARLADEAVLRRAAQPDAASVARIARTPLDRVWERGRDDDDLLRLRVGLASLPARLRTVCGGRETPAGQVHAVPLEADLRTGPLGVAGARRPVLGVARWLVAQLVTQASPADVELAALLSEDAHRCWTWLRWVPHLGARIATTTDERERLCADLTELVTTRARASAPPGRRLVLLVDRVGTLGELPLLASLLESGPAVGVTALCLDDRETGLPAACRAVAVIAGDTGARLLLRAGDTMRVAVPDRLDERSAEQLARSLAPLVDASTDPGSTLPDQCRLVDLLGATRPGGPAVQVGWRRSTGRADTVLGAGADGPVAVDLERDGPHALIAGTTGAGKSELLQTLVVGLALAHPPDELSFVLIDYKGGSAFADCARLPHTAGLVTDLDEGLTRRALRSLHAELRRRERLFADAGVADIAAYRASSPGRSLTRLLLVVDEFATLAGELPAFVDGLVGVAQRGRSLGIHLVLATQRPAGVVSKDIRANTALRIALRVTDPADSSDVIDAPDAAQLDRRIPGRALVRRGSSTVVMQVARVSGPAAPAPRAGGEVTVTPLGPWRSLPDEHASTAAPDELELLVDAVVDAAERGNYPPVDRPWLPPLPRLVQVTSLPGKPSDGPPAVIPFGLLDLPDQQRRATLTIDLASGGSLLLVGGARSGRTTGLLSLAATAARRLAPTELQLYAIDGAGGGLAALARLPHLGSLVGVGDDLGAVETLLARLCDLVGGRGSRGVERPARVLLLDGWEAFAASAAERDGGCSVERLLALLRDGPAAGLTIAVGGGRAALAPRVAGHFGTRLVLPVVDASDWALAGLAPPAGRDSTPGRAVRIPDAVEVQLAVPGSSAAPGELDLALRGCADRWRDAPRGTPVRVRALPSRIALKDLGAAPGRWILGVGATSAEIVSVDLFAGVPRLLVAGPPRSGRSCLLHSILIQARAGGVAVVVAAPARSPLRAAADSAGIAVLGPGDAAPGPPRSSEGAVLLVDDSEAFADSATGDVLAEWARSDRADLAVVVAARSADLAVTFRGVAAEVRRVQCGVLLQPGPVDGELLGIRLPRTRHPSPPGRGMLVGDPHWGAICAGGPVPIQVASP